jgi:sugar lactone lactonase YvrE
MKTKDTVRMVKMAAVALAMVVSAKAQTLLVTELGGNVGLYNATNGAVINGAFISWGGAYDVTHGGSSIYVSNINNGSIGVFDLATGAAISSFATGLSFPSGVAYHNGILYVANFEGGAVKSFNAATGAVINSSLLTTGGTRFLEVYNGNLYVGDYTTNTIGLYQLDGTPINTSFISISNPGGITFSGTSLYVTTSGGNTISEFNALTGALINSSLITSGLSTPQGLAADNNGTLYVANLGDGGSIAAYSTSGTSIYAGSAPVAIGIDYIPVPEPGSMLLCAAGLGVLGWTRRKRSSAI